jgi:hypothetical protein
VELIAVPADHWVNSAISWKESNLNNVDGKYLGATVNTLEFLALFPRPRLVPVPFSGQIFGCAFIADLDAPEIETPPQKRPRPGAPSADERLLQKALLRVLSKRKEAGTLPEKGDAIIAAAQEWVRDQIGEELSRTTAQRYLETLLPKKPRTAAHK